MRWSPIWRRPRSHALSLGLVCAATAAAILLLFASILLLFGVVGFPTGASDSGTRTAGFSPVEDTYVKSAQRRPYGRATTIQADNWPAMKLALIRFRVTGIPNGASVSSATLRLFVVDPSRTAGTVRAVNGTWSEATTTWTNAPAVGAKTGDLRVLNFDFTAHRNDPFSLFPLIMHFALTRWT